MKNDINELDARILKSITTNRNLALEFSYKYSHNLFDPSLNLISKIIVNYIKNYRSIPTRRVLKLQYSTDDNILNQIDILFDHLDNLEYDINEYAFDIESIKRRYTERKILSIKESINDKTSDGIVNDPSAILSELNNSIQEIHETQKTQGHIQQTLQEYITQFEELYEAKSNDESVGRGIPTGYRDIDIIIDGLHTTEMLIIGGASGSGKSMLLNNIAVQMWMQQNSINTSPQHYVPGHNVMYFSLEMPYDLCFNRTMAKISNVRSRELKNAKLDENELNNLKAGVDFIKNYPYHFEIIDIPRNVTIEQIELRFEEAKNKFDPQIVVVDYLGLMDDSTETQDWLKLGVIAGKLHEFARAHNIIMLSAVQLNDGDDKSKSKGKIGLHRIGRSRLIAHHASVVIQIEDRKDEKDFADLSYHIIKNREGQLDNGFLRKKFTHATLLDSNGLEMNDDSDDISDLIENVRADDMEDFPEEN